MSHVQYMLVGNRQRIQASDRRKRKLTRQRIDGKKGSTWIILGTYIWTSHQRNPLNHSVQHSTSEGSVQTPHVQLRAIRKHGMRRCRRMKDGESGSQAFWLFTGAVCCQWNWFSFKNSKKAIHYVFTPWLPLVVDSLSHYHHDTGEHIVYIGDVSLWNLRQCIRQ